MKTEQNSSYKIDVDEDPRHDEVAIWTFKPDGENRYGNAISFSLEDTDVEKFQTLSFDVKIEGDVYGRVGCHIDLENGERIGLGDFHSVLTPGKWVTISFPLPMDYASKPSSFQIFNDGLAWPAGEYRIAVDNIRFGSDVAAESESQPPVGTLLPKFSSLGLADQNSLLRSVEPPSLRDRDTPYSTPMYYPQWGSGTPDGRQHTDWQEALVAEWAELGMTKLHVYLYPDGNSTDKISFKVTDATKVGLSELRRLCEKYGIKIGLRIDIPNLHDASRDLPGRDPFVTYWPSHPRNPKNVLTQYLAWVREIIEPMKEDVEYVVIGDEISDTASRVQGGELPWSNEDYLRVLEDVSSVIRGIAPNAIISGFAASSGRWNDVMDLIKHGYAQRADAVAINHYDYNSVSKFFDDIRRVSSEKPLKLLSNGVGYIASDTALRNPSQDPYSKYTDEQQASMVAKSMFTWWRLGAVTAPYYVCIRNRVYHGKTEPLWYGFFGFMDFVIDENDRASFVRYPAWYAFQTIANTFHDRRQFKDWTEKVKMQNVSGVVLNAYEVPGKELLIIAWSEGGATVKDDIVIDSSAYGTAVKVALLNYKKWKDVSSSRIGDKTILRNISISSEPTIIRLFPDIAESRMQVRNAHE